MAGKESTQKKLGRIRPPRVHITYDVEVGGAIESREVPFVVGVMADLSGMPKEKLDKMTDRPFTEVDRDNIDTVMARARPRLVFQVENTLQKREKEEDKSVLGVELNFEKRADFSPDAVARQVPALRKLMELRGKLSNLQSSLYGNSELDDMLQKVVKATEAARQPGDAPKEPEK
jgi:type VI secretion system protein ImpB